MARMDSRRADSWAALHGLRYPVATAGWTPPTRLGSKANVKEPGR
jgi:hypothetical protein